MSILIDRVIEEIRKDFTNGDLTALDELLSFVPRKNLIGYLPEEEWDKYEPGYLPYAISTSDGHNEEWTYYNSELEAHETFIYMQGYETDIHLYKLNTNNEYEVIDSWWIDDNE